MQRLVIGAAATVVCVTGGAWAGNDAVGQVDQRYRDGPEIAYRDPVVRAVPAAMADAEPEPNIASAPPAGSLWGQDVGRDERAFFDNSAPEPTTETLPDPPRVRVHRVKVPPPPPLPPPVPDVPLLGAGDGVEDSWVASPADAGEPPPREPSR